MQPSPGLPQSLPIVSPVSGEPAALDPNSIDDSRRRTLQAIVARQGAPKFRAELIIAYEGRCAATGCDLPAALEAAHIHPYRGAQTNLISNGLLLRADVHTLFDLGLIAVDSDGCWVISDDLRDTTYAKLAGRQLHQPTDPSNRPAPELLRWHFEENGFNQ
jgi:predicted restriction endonuclease